MNHGYANSAAAAVLTALVGIYPYYSRRTEVTRLFALSNGLLALWNLSDLVILLPLSHLQKLILYRASYVIGTLVVWYFFNFMLVFGKVDWKQFEKVRSGFRAAGALLALLCVATPWIILDIRETAYPMDVPGVLFPVFMVYLMSGLGFGFFWLCAGYRSAWGQQRNQIKYLMAALFFGLIEGPLFFFDVYAYHITSFFYYSQVIYSLIVAYAIMAHHLMDISLVIRKTLIYSVVTGVLAAIVVFVAMLSVHFAEGVLGQETFWALGVAACLITAIFHPLQLRVQKLIDRFLFRDWADQEVAREIASGFSHELKSPLAGLSLQAQLAMAELTDVEAGKIAWMHALPKIKKGLQYLVSQSMDAARRIEAVRGVAEPGRGRMEPVRVSELVDNSLSFLQELISHTKVNIRRELPINIPPICGDAKQLEIVFINLMKNAVQAMDSGDGSMNHQLTLSAQARDGSVLISIKDTGSGIAAKDVSRIFEPYFTTKGYKGTGMGLYLTQQIVKSHGGTIGVQSNEGEGTEFIVRLPKFMSEKTSGIEAA